MTNTKNEYAVRNVHTGVYKVFAVRGEQVIIETVDAKGQTITGTEWMSKAEARIEWMNLRNWDGHVVCPVP